MQNPTLVIMQGLPGSGKTTAARRFVQRLREEGAVTSSAILSTDDYFTFDGHYHFDVRYIRLAHQWNQRRCRWALGTLTELVIIDNPNIRAWEARSYVRIAVEHEYDVQIIRVDTPWSENVDECFRRCTHHVPREVIARMYDNLEDLGDGSSDDIERILQSKSPWEN